MYHIKFLLFKKIIIILLLFWIIYLLDIQNVFSQKTSIVRLVDEFHLIESKFRKIATDSIIANIKMYNPAQLKNFKNTYLDFYFFILLKAHDSINEYTFDKNFCEYLYIDSNINIFKAVVKYKNRIYGWIDCNEFNNILLFYNRSQCKFSEIRKSYLRKLFKLKRDSPFVADIFEYGYIPPIIIKDTLLIISEIKNSKGVDVNKYIKNKYSEQEIRNIFIDKKK